jgi:protein required for attachment to host cells
MYRVCIALVDATRARLFMFDRAADEAGLHDQLLEHGELVNPARQPQPVPALAAAPPGAGHPHHLHDAFDEHRGYRTAKHDAEFARTALAALREMIDHNAPQRVILCAGPRMLGTLRESCSGILPDHLPVEELARDLVQMSPSDLRSELVSHGLLPPPPRLRPAA